MLTGKNTQEHFQRGTSTEKTSHSTFAPRRDPGRRSTRISYNVVPGVYPQLSSMENIHSKYKYLKESHPQLCRERIDN